MIPLNNIKSQYDTFMAPDMDELLNKSKELKAKIPYNDFLRNSITKLENKIVLSTNSRENNILNQQIEELEKINSIYQENVSKNITIKTSKKINDLLGGIKEQINLKENTLSDDRLKIEKIYENESERFDDTIDIFTTNTTRDLVENSIDIIGIKESVFSEQYQDVFDMMTLTYINFLENKGLNTKDFIQNKGLYLDEADMKEFKRDLIDEFIFYHINFDIDFDFQIKYSKGTKVKYETVNFKKHKDKLDINYAIENEIDENEINENKTAKYKKINTNNEISETLNQGNYLDNLNNNGLSKEVINHSKLLIPLILKGKVKINKKTLINLQKLITFIVHIESDGYNIDNTEGSLAMGYFQYLNGNRENRKNGVYNSFDTALRRCKNFFKKLNGKIPDWVNNSYNNINSNPKQLSQNEQTILFLTDMFYKSGTNKHLINVLNNGNFWSMRRLYEDFHHTTTKMKDKDKDKSKNKNNKGTKFTTKETEDRTNLIITKYEKKYNT